MWCRDCAQDVPALPSRQSAEYVCARCGAKIEHATDSTSRPTTDSAAMTAAITRQKAPRPDRAAASTKSERSTPDISSQRLAYDEAVASLAESAANESPKKLLPTDWSSGTPGGALVDWQFEDALRDVEATLRRRSTAVTAARRPLRIDARQASAPAWNAARPQRIENRGVENRGIENRADRTAAEPTATQHADRAEGGGGSWLAWLVLWPGMTAFVCGSVLLVCSIVQQRDELWRVGLPLTLVGQGAIFFGGAMLVERLWSQRRSTGGPARFDQHMSEDEAFDDPPAAPSRRTPNSSRRWPPNRRRRTTLGQAFQGDAGQMLDELQDRLDQLARRL